MKELIAIINKHNYNYYVLDNPTISDSEWDKLYDELINLEEETGSILPDSPTQKVGNVVLDKFTKVTHKHAVYSLDKATSIEEVEKWVTGIEKEIGKKDYFIDYKYDGLTVLLEYEGGKLIKASTRGDGKIGEDVTAQVSTIRSVPLTIPFLKNAVFHGECVMKLSELEKYNAKNEDILKNARNAAAGGLRNLDTSVTKSRNLDVIVYNVLSAENENFKTQKEMHDFIKNNNFMPTLKYYQSGDVKDIAKILEKIAEEKKSLDVLTDGVVIKLNDIASRNEIGYTAKFPKFMLAFKFPAELVTTKLLDVVWQVGRTGKITPNAIVEPVELSGAKISRATLNNFQDITRKKLKINSRVFIRRSNEVIPEILELAEELPDSREIIKIRECPSCGSNLKEIGANLFCLNSKNCKEQIKESIVHFTSRDGMNIEGISEKTIHTFMENLNLKNISDIYSLKKEDIEKLDLFKEKKATNVINAINESKNIPLNKFIYALGILNVGKKTAEDLTSKFSSFEEIKNAEYEDLRNIDGIGDVVALNIVEYFKNTDHLEVINALYDRGVKIQDATNKLISDKLSGKTFVITGSMIENSRDEISNMIVKNGGKSASSVSKKTDYVIYGENAGSKKTKAELLGIKLITEDEFYKILGE